MIINDKLKKEKGNPVFLYKEGVFWVAYEQSAYYFWQCKGYKPTKRYMKSIAREVVSIGFPTNALEAFLDGSEDVVSYEMHDNSYLFHLKEPIAETVFSEWKSELPLQENSSATKAEASPSPGSGINQQEALIISKLREFPLANKTPLECMVFLSELKRWI
jgi:hypothetical protein